jgi:outer membrane protein
MRITKRLTLLYLFFVSVLHVAAQDKWDLRRCVEYALEHNTSIRQADIDARFAKLNVNQTKAAQIGTANLFTQIGLNYGRTIDQTTNIYTDNQNVSQYYNLNYNVTLFNWFSLRRNIEANQLTYQAQTTNIDKLKNDVTLNVANAYLLALLANKQVELARTKLFLTRNQLSNTRALVDAGSLPELNAAELEVQFATDTAAVITAVQTYDIDNLQLKAILNLDAAAPFDLDTPPVEKIPVEPIANLQPDAVYAIAISAFPQQKMNDLRIGAAEKNVDYTHGLLYPTISAYGSLGTRFYNDLRQVNTTFPISLTKGYAQNGVVQYPVYAQGFEQTFTGQPFFNSFQGYGSQLENNFGQQVGLQLNIPIFNGLMSKTNYKKAKLNVETARLTKENDLMTLKQGIYQAYYNAVASLEKFGANKKATEVAEKSFDLATKRYEIGMLNTIDYLTNQNNLFTARINMLIAQYDYVFRIKVLEYYKGLGIKL